MAKTAYVNVRIDNALKDRAEKVFARLGVNSSQALTMFYRQVAMRHAIPFDLSIPNAATRRAMAEADAGGGKRYSGTGAGIIDRILNE